jgi:hypothetical protein
LGCCFGTDTRQVLVDGWKEENVSPVDVIPDFWFVNICLSKKETLC